MRRFVCRLAAFCMLTFLVLEVVLRTVVPASEKAFTASEPRFHIYRYLRDGDTTGVFTFGRRAQHAAYWHINNEGWNSVVDYHPPSERTSRVVAIVGDSYVEALNVDVNRNLATVLDRMLEDGWDVYSFGLADTPLSQTIQTARRIGALPCRLSGWEMSAPSFGTCGSTVHWVSRLWCLASSCATGVWLSPARSPNLKHAKWRTGRRAPRPRNVSPLTNCVPVPQRSSCGVSVTNSPVFG